jgi:predicted aspartyl protease/Tfp pilus assembly protein PilF
MSCATSVHAETPTSGRCTLQKIVDLPVTMDGLRATVPAKINGQDVRFMTDTGAFYSMLSKPSAERLGLKVHRGREGFHLDGVSGGSTEVGLATANTFSLGDASRDKVEFIVAGSSYAPGTVGLLGENVLGAFDAEYDFRNGALRLFKSSDCGDAVLAYWAAGGDVPMMAVDPINSSNSHITGWATLDGRTIRVVFDSGAPHSTLNKSMAEQLGFKPTSADARAASITSGIGGGISESWLYRFDLLTLGGEQIKNAQLRIADLRMTVDLILGADFFLSHHIYFARDQHRLYFTYNGGPVFRIGDSPDAQAAATTRQVDREAATDPNELGRLASAELARGEYSRAIADFSRAIALGGKDPDLFLQRGRAHEGAGDQALAQADFDRALAISPGDVEVVLARAELEIKEKRTAAAGADLDAAIAASSDDWQTRMAVARLYVRAHLIPKAIAQYDAWMAAHPDGTQGAVRGARCHARALAGDRLEQALADCDVGLQYGHPTAEAHVDRGLVRMRLKKYRMAIFDYNDALDLQPKLAWAFYGRGLAKIADGRRVEGDADITAAVALQPDLPAEAASYGLAMPAATATPAH